MKNEKNISGDYYVGLDIGTNSVGYAVTDEDYSLIKFRGEPMWGVTVFEEAEGAEKRRAFRTARRRLDRRQQRVLYTQEIFADEISKVDERYYLRLKESALFRADTECKDEYAYFNDAGFSDKDYHKKYPTVHHLLCELMSSKEKHDVRLVYTAVAWLMAHRGHFLNEVDKENIDKVLDFSEVYGNMMNCFEEAPWNCDMDAFKEVIKRKSGISRKEKAFSELLFSGKKYKPNEDDYCNIALVIKLLSGGRVSPQKLFYNEEYSEVPSFSLSMPDEDYSAILAQLEDDAELLIKLRAVYDWALLADILGGFDTISQAKVAVYEQHAKDLAGLKKFVKKYAGDKYSSIFRRAGKQNYVAYSYNEKSLKAGERVEKKATKEAFCDYLKKELAGISPNDEDKAFYEDMMSRLEAYTFMPKQVNGDNRVIPYQLYWHELNIVLKNASTYLPFLNEKDKDGYSGTEKLLAIFEFRVPYYVGPLRKDNSANAWIVRKKEGKITPWSFSETVDLDKSEAAFINRMTNKCTYLCDEDVVAKWSLLYSKYSILNEINLLRVNDCPISVEDKQAVFELFEKERKVSVKIIKDCLISRGSMKKDGVLSGIDISVKSSYKPYHDFKNYMISGVLSEEDVERIIERMTYSEDKTRIRKYLRSEFLSLGEDDIAYISKLNYSDFGRLSAKFLRELSGVNKETGEVMTVIEALWATNNNLMQLLSDKFTYLSEVEKYRDEYYSEHSHDINSMLDEMYISNAVKRPIYRTLDIIKEINKAVGKAPAKIFVEMARGGGEKGKRTATRRSQIEELYKNIAKSEIRELSKQLEGVSDNELQSEKLFLYFMQLGKSMYSNTEIKIEKLKTEEYNVDHIYPQSKTKDDSLTNKVLVLSTENEAKGDIYPVAGEIRKGMGAYWKMLLDSKLISEEKYKRLTRSTGFTDSEKLDFINRQLVETRQSTKAVATLLKMLFPNTEIVYVKAGLVSDFRKEFDMLKSRQLNDLHHAKDAYLNIVCGNVYSSRFTKRFFSIKDEYSLNTRTLYTRGLKLGGKTVWSGDTSLAKVRAVTSKNNIHLTRYAFMRKGGFFDQMPVKASGGLVERKKGLDTSRYGGYNKAAATCFVLASYVFKTKADIMFVPIELMYADELFGNDELLKAYLHSTIAAILGKPESMVESVTLPLGARPIKINTVISLDGFRVCVLGKAGGGKQVIFSSAISLVADKEKENYIKKLESFDKKQKENTNIVVIKDYDKISAEANEKLYDWFVEKLSSKPYSTAVFSNQYETLKNGKERFVALPVEKQVTVLLNILLLFKTFRSGGCDITGIGGAPNAGVFLLNSKLSNWSKYSDVRIIDSSAAGLHEKSSENLMKML